MFGDGRTKLQPVYADDVAAAITQVLRQSETPDDIYELAGPRVYSYAELLRMIAREAGLRPVLLHMPFAVWHPLASLAEMLPHPLITRNQVELDASRDDCLGFARDFASSGILPRSLERAARADAQATWVTKVNRQGLGEAPRPAVFCSMIDEDQMRSAERAIDAEQWQQHSAGISRVSFFQLGVPDGGHCFAH